MYTGRRVFEFYKYVNTNKYAIVCYSYAPSTHVTLFHLHIITINLYLNRKIYNKNK